MRGVSHDRASLAGAATGAIIRTRTLVDEYLAHFPSARVAHYAAALEALSNAISVELMKAEEREQRQADNARDRIRRNWEPHQIRAAERMGFADPADWRRYIDEREASDDPSSFPTPEEWRAR